MQFCKVISYKLRVFKIVCNILPFICVETPLGSLYGDFQPGLKFQLGIPSWNFISGKQ